MGARKMPGNAEYPAWFVEEFPARRDREQLMLDINELIRPAGQRLSRDYLADILGCTDSNIFNIEMAAIAKMRRASGRREAGSADEKKAKPAEAQRKWRSPPIHIYERTPEMPRL
jgi:hypothetical protein